MEILDSVNCLRLAHVINDEIKGIGCDEQPMSRVKHRLTAKIPYAKLNSWLLSE
jgi:hypothetical protein